MASIWCSTIGFVLVIHYIISLKYDVEKFYLIQSVIYSIKLFFCCFDNFIIISYSSVNVTLYKSVGKFCDYIHYLFLLAYC